ncbi:MAG TPA: patatin-like phospholipase family protein [Chthoniobacteraceae bacterium]|nr:patatin-like phospholipase family protein [Chthoniobacteraceae bacterium]
MFRRPHQSEAAKSLADILEEELGSDVGPSGAQASPEAEKQARLRAVYARIHELESKRSALCLSGGGIRSASFGLGVIQALARAGVLEKFDYLSTVSGGGYIGGWLTAWMQNHPAGREGVLADLKTTPDSTLAPEREPIRHLRAFSNYLTPRLGLFSADTWTLGATLVRNVFLNWIVLLSWLAALLLIPRFGVLLALARPGPAVMNSLLVVAFAGFVIGTAYAAIDLPSLGNARWKQRRFVASWLVPMFGGVACFLAWWAGFRNTDKDALSTMDSSAGLYATQLFVGAATAVGCLAAACMLTWRDRGKNEPRPSFSKLLALAGILLVTVLLTGALSGYFGWWVAARVFPDPARHVRNFVCFAPPLVLALYFAANALFIGITSWFGEDEDREWWGRAGGWLISAIMAWAALHALVLWVPLLVAKIDPGAIGNAVLAAGGGILGLVTAILGYRGTKEGGLPAADASSLRTKILAAAALGFFILLSCGLSRLLDVKGAGFAELDERWWTIWERGEFWNLLRFTALLIGVGVIMGLFINVNKFSLHAMYRNRLIRAFLGASRPERKPHWFTGFDPRDNFSVHEIKAGRPFHVINIALNLVSGRQLAWQERMAASFTVSRLHSGSWLLGYRSSREYGAGISLGSALAISGAAANPNQGYHSSPLVAFLMTLFNVRLGWWLGNPGDAGARTWNKRGPAHAALPLFAEALGNTTDSYANVNLSDGGHFDNLGLYEMILRRCRHIVAIDAGCDSNYLFEDLGSAIRKVRIDLGIPIDIHVVSPKKEGVKASYYVLGTIRYSVIDGPGTDGQLLYIKPVIGGEEPTDIAHYASAHPDFPHEPTTDQWFSESQFESYRALGFHAVSAVCQGVRADATLGEFFENLKQRSIKSAPGDSPCS